MLIKAFHGTAVNFKRFDDSRMRGVNYGKSFYFTEDPEEASSFIQSDEGGYILEVELEINNPFDVHSIAHAKILASVLGLSWPSVKSNYNHLLEGSGLDESDRENHYHKIINELFDIGAGSN